MTQITSTNKKSFKNYIRSNSNLFDSNLISCYIANIKNLFDSEKSGLDHSSPAHYLIFNSGDVVDISTKLFDGDYLYLPGLENDIIGLKNGSSSINLGFDSYGRFYYGQYLIPIGTQINLGDKKFTVNALGGALLEVTDIPPGPTYDVVESSTAVNEGDTVTFTVNTTLVEDGTTLYYTISGDVSAEDFTDNALSGSVSINDNTASFSKTLANDLTPVGTEGTESFTVSLRLDSVTGTILTSSSQVTVSDTSVLSYSISESSTTLNEGDTVTFTISTQGVPNGTTLYYTTSGTVSSNDFEDNTLSGSFTISNGSATLTKTLSNDLSIVGTENQENFKIQIRTDSESGDVVAESSTVTVEDTSVSSYTLTESSTSINEGESITFTLDTTGISDGTTLYFTSTNTTDVNPPSGSFVVNSNTSSFSVAVLEDAEIESDETFYIQVRTLSTSGDVVATSSEITILNTTSVSVGVSTDIIAEGESVTFTITPTGIPNGTVLYYSHSGDALPQSGNFTIINGSGAFTLSATEDPLIEGSESFTVDIKNSSDDILATSSQITITNTTSIALVPSSTLSTEGGSFSFVTNTTGIPDGTTLYFTTSNNAANEIDITPTNGSFTINNDIGSFSISINQDYILESLEFLEVQVRAQSLTGPIVANSPVLQINNSPFSMDVIPEKTVIPESSLGNDSTLKINISTTNVGNGATFTAVLNTSLSSADSSDFVGFASTSFAIFNNLASFTIPISRDARTEGRETFTIDVQNSVGDVVAQSPIIAITDVSYIGSRQTGKTFGPILVNRDDGIFGNISDWYNLCNLEGINKNSKVVICIDTSGSMNMNTVEKSYGELARKLRADGIEVVLIENNNEDWISPFDKDFN